MSNSLLLPKVDDFCSKLRQRRVDGSLSAAKGTAELLRQLVTLFKGGDPRGLLEEVRNVGVKLQSSRPAGKYRRVCLGCVLNTAFITASQR